MAKLEVGAKAPAFHLMNPRSKKIRLSDSEGKRTVVYFYPKADTPGCTTQACELNSALLALKKLKAVVIGISPDPPERQKAFADKFDLKFPLLSDEDHKVAEKWGVWGEKSLYGRKYFGIVRSAFVLDERGKVLSAFYKISPKDTVAKVTAVLEG